MMIAQTSQAAYSSIVHQLGDRQQAVFDQIETQGSASIEMVADALRAPMHTISGRFTELKRYGYIKAVGVTANKSGRSATLWATTDPSFEKKIKELDCEG